ncbi:MAG: polyphosphate polymerase domain-containing protein [Bacteroidales bacterium]
MRFEYKYVVDNKHLSSIREMILPFVDQDNNAIDSPEGHYTVRSIYFDTPALDFYFEKIEGIRNRKKLRIRGYDEGGPDDLVFLEIKRKYSIPILKHRAALKYDEAVKMFRERHINGFFPMHEGPGSRDDARRFFYHLYSKNLRPVVLVVYDREPWLCKFDSTIRITFDKNLRGKAYPGLEDLYSEQDLIYALPGKFIMEVKFNDKFPYWLSPVLARYGLKKRSASKYTMCMRAAGLGRTTSEKDVLFRSKWS